MENDPKKPSLSDADLALVASAAEVLLIDALTFTQADPSLAIGALSLALASAAVLAQIPLEVMLTMFSMQYANQLVLEAEQILKNATPVQLAEVPAKPPKTNKDLN